jgi:hypothetical protein
MRKLTLVTGSPASVSSNWAVAGKARNLHSLGEATDTPVFGHAGFGCDHHAIMEVIFISYPDTIYKDIDYKSVIAISIHDNSELGGAMNKSEAAAGEVSPPARCLTRAAVPGLTEPARIPHLFTR